MPCEIYNQFSREKFEPELGFESWTSRSLAWHSILIQMPAQAKTLLLKTWVPIAQLYGLCVWSNFTLEVLQMLGLPSVRILTCGTLLRVVRVRLSKVPERYEKCNSLKVPERYEKCDSLKVPERYEKCDSLKVPERYEKCLRASSSAKKKSPPAPPSGREWAMS